MLANLLKSKHDAPNLSPAVPADGRVVTRVRTLAGARFVGRDDTCTCGLMVSSCRPAWKTTAEDEANHYFEDTRLDSSHDRRAVLQ